MPLFGCGYTLLIIHGKLGPYLEVHNIDYTLETRLLFGCGYTLLIIHWKLGPYLGVGTHY